MKAPTHISGCTYVQRIVALSANLTATSAFASHVNVRHHSREHVRTYGSVFGFRVCVATRLFPVRPCVHTWGRTRVCTSQMPGHCGVEGRSLCDPRKLEGHRGGLGSGGVLAFGREVDAVLPRCLQVVFLKTIRMQSYAERTSHAPRHTPSTIQARFCERLCGGCACTEPSIAGTLVTLRTTRLTASADSQILVLKCPSVQALEHPRGVGMHTCRRKHLVAFARAAETGMGDEYVMAHTYAHSHVRARASRGFSTRDQSAFSDSGTETQRQQAKGYTFVSPSLRTRPGKMSVTTTSW